jgi:hypothetical protein
VSVSHAKLGRPVAAGDAFRGKGERDPDRWEPADRRVRADPAGRRLAEHTGTMLAAAETARRDPRRPRAWPPLALVLERSDQN